MAALSPKGAVAVRPITVLNRPDKNYRLAIVERKSHNYVPGELPRVSALSTSKNCPPFLGLNGRPVTPIHIRRAEFNARAGE